MKILGSIVVFLTLLFVGFQVVAYQLTETDLDLLDRVEERLFTIIDENDSLTAEKAESLVEQVLTRDLPDRTITLLEIILDDLRYVYYLGDYGEAVYTQSEDECYDDEYFDPQDQRCYYDDENYSYYDEENLIGDDYREESNFDYADAGHDHSHEYYAAEKILATYAIHGDTITLLSGKTTPKYENAWNTFSTIIPVHMRQDFKKYKVFDSEESEIAAHVSQDEEDHTMWNITINMAAVYGGEDTLTKEGIATLLHEYAHVLTLNKTQIRYAPMTDNEEVYHRFAQNCPNRMVQEGCLNADAYLDDFIDTFWNNEADLKTAQEEGGDVYTGNESNFITDYAATNPGEDIAESFTYFVLNAKPTGTTGADKKLNFFYNYKELDSLRKKIRSNMDMVTK